MIGKYDINNIFPEELSETMEIQPLEVESGELPFLDGLIIDWVDKADKNAFSKQALLVEHYIKKRVPTVIYDRNFTLLNKEYNWLQKFKTFFFEPAINNRIGFGYLPQYTQMLSMDDFDLWEERDRNIDLLYMGPLKNKLSSFERYYKEFASLYPDAVVAYCDDTLPIEKIQEYNDCNLRLYKNPNWNDVKCTLLIDSSKNYRIGYLDPVIFEAMKNGCIPLLPAEHRYFGNMFGYDINSHIDVDFYVSTIGDASEAIIEDIYNRIESYYSEFTINYFCDIIKGCFK
jgi:hypothetical protein